nr:Uncharacterised protein [Klebsiella pneumoniae]
MADQKKMTLPTVNDPSGQLARQWDIRNANAGGHFSRRGKVGYHRLDQQLGNAPAAVAGLPVDRRALAVLCRVRRIRHPAYHSALTP